MQRAWVLVFVLACGGSSPAPQSPASAPAVASAGVPCETAVGKMMDALIANKPDAPPEEVKHFHDLFAAHCQSDAWTRQVRDCFGAMKTLDDGDACATQMTEPQRQAIDDAMKPDPPDALVQPAPGRNAPAPAAEEAPAAQPPPASRAPKPPKKGGDPCEGGD